MQNKMLYTRNLRGSVLNKFQKFHNQMNSVEVHEGHTNKHSYIETYIYRCTNFNQSNQIFVRKKKMTMYIQLSYDIIYYFETINTTIWCIHLPHLPN